MDPVEVKAMGATCVFYAGGGQLRSDPRHAHCDRWDGFSCDCGGGCRCHRASVLGAYVAPLVVRDGRAAASISSIARVVILDGDAVELACGERLHVASPGTTLRFRCIESSQRYFIESAPSHVFVLRPAVIVVGRDARTARGEDPHEPFVEIGEPEALSGGRYAMQVTAWGVACGEPRRRPCYRREELRLEGSKMIAGACLAPTLAELGPLVARAEDAVLREAYGVVMQAQAVSQ